MHAPVVWAVVLTHGGAEEITAACLESLLAQDYANLTTLLVDNASFDGSGARLRDRYPAVRYLNTGGNFGYTGGNNRGIAHAMADGAEYLLVMNNDTILERSCVRQLVDSLPECERLGAIAPKILYFDDPARVWYAGGDYSMLRALGLHRGEMQLDDPTEPPRIEPTTFVTGCCFLMPAEVARSQGVFREDFFIYAEDAELSLRLRRAGYRLYYQPAARMLHRESMRRSMETPFQIVQRDRYRRRLVKQHYNRRERAWFALWFYPSRMVRLAQYAVRGDWERARALVAAATARI